MTLFDPAAVNAERIEPSNISKSVAAQFVRVALGVSYDGSSFHGFAPQPGQVTVAGAILEVLSQLVAASDISSTQAAIECVCAGRTDAGVHAVGQVIHVDLPATVLEQRFHANLEVGAAIEALQRALNARLAPQIAIWRTVLMPANFDARRSATSRRYRYRIDVNERAAPLRANVAWQLDTDLDLSLLRLASDALLGEHDFAAFCRRPKDQPDGPLTRRVTDVRWSHPTPQRYAVEIEANAFCHQMVRAIVGALVAIGQANLAPSAILQVLRGHKRSNLAAVAPAHGLCLTDVRYPEPFSSLFGEPDQQSA